MSVEAIAEEEDIHAINRASHFVKMRELPQAHPKPTKTL
jgi:hypothetical protein